VLVTVGPAARKSQRRNGIDTVPSTIPARYAFFLLLRLTFQ
jgi:hypothetical protein